MSHAHKQHCRTPFQNPPSASSSSASSSSSSSASRSPLGSGPVEPVRSPPAESMSISSEHSDSGSLAAKNPARPLEKSTFAHTCSLLSQYLKEKGSLGDLNLGRSPPSADATGAPGMSHHAAPTMNLFPISEKSANVFARNIESRNVKFMDLFPQRAGFGSTKEDFAKTSNSSFNKKEPEAAQMTIFYAGQVIVLNDFPADKAKEVMLAASKASSLNQHVAAAPNLAKSKPAFAPNYAKNPVESGGVVTSSPVPVPALGANAIQEHIHRPTETLACDLPIARKASLHRFLEKRKDRLTARAPYMTTSPGSAAAPPPKPAETKPWLGLAPQPTQ